MKKCLVLAALLLVTNLAGCGSMDSKNSSSSSDNATEAKVTEKGTEEGFMTLVSEYMTAQQNLMLKQAEEQSDSFEVASEHSKAVVNSEEYKEIAKKCKITMLPG